jgi:AbrB family looped-hinge helix DNA binding protein
MIESNIILRMRSLYCPTLFGMISMTFMRTKVTERGQVSIPAAIRRKLGITANTALEWVLEGNAVRVIPVPEDPAAALRGAGKRGAVRRLLDDRRRDRRRDA